LDGGIPDFFFTGANQTENFTRVKLEMTYITWVKYTINPIIIIEKIRQI